MQVAQHKGRHDDEGAAADDADGQTKGLPPVTENSSAALTKPLIAPWPMAAARQLPVRTVTYVRKMPTTMQNRHMAAMPPMGQVG